MPTFQVRNKRTKIILGEVTVEDPAQVLDALVDACGCSIDDVAASLGSTLEEARAALEIVEVLKPEPPARMLLKVTTRPLKRRQLFA